MNYATGYALNINEIFSLFKTSKMTMSTKACEELIGNRHKEKVAQSVFKHALSLVIDGIIDNGDIFSLPTRSRKSELKMKRFDRETFAKARRAGKWQDVDFLISNFSAYQMILELQSKGITRQKLVYLDSTHRDRITENTNKGVQYF